MAQKDPFLKYGLLEQALNYAYDNCIPLIATLELTHDCNLSCVHCYNFDRTTQKKSPLKKLFLSDQEIESVIIDLSKLGTLFINFSGGEALLHPSLHKFISLTKSLHMEARLKSNGILLDQRKIEELLDSGLNSIDISLYGHNNEIYSHFCNSADGFSKVEAALKILATSKLDTHINVILHKYNVENIRELINFCEELQLPFQFSTEVTSRYDNTSTSRVHEMTVEQYQGLLQGEFAHYFQGDLQDNGLQCSCARSVCGISVTGDVFPCIGAPIPSGNIRKKSLIDIWNNSNELNKIRGIKREDFKDCIKCEYIESCNRSSGSIYVNTGNYTGCEETTYKLAKISHEIKKINN
jgi:radical SAM protein with 4Fe4S-binding SPASM domain